MTGWSLIQIGAGDDGEFRSGEDRRTVLGLLIEIHGGRAAAPVRRRLCGAASGRTQDDDGDVSTVRGETQL